MKMNADDGERLEKICRISQMLMRQEKTYEDFSSHSHATDYQEIAKKAIYL